MSDARSVRLSPELVDTVSTAAKWRGMPIDRYVEKVLTLAARLDAELAADLKEADDDFAAGRFYTQEQVEAMFNVRREQRNAA